MSEDDQSERANHWDSVWTTNAPETASWFEASPTQSLELIELHAAPTFSVIDIGGGASPLASCLSRDGFRDLSVLDISNAALAVNRKNFGEFADEVDWIVADIIEWSPSRVYDVWHDRAVFHFLITESHVAQYARTAAAAVAPGGLLVISTFGSNGPKACSGLPVQRRSISTLSACFTDHFAIINSAETPHVTPNGATQEFVYIVAQRFATIA